MATHEQLPSTSSRPILDPTTSTQEKSDKDAAPKTALNQASAELQSEKQTICFGTRRSKLAVIQAELVQRQLEKERPDLNYKICAMATMGDNNQTTPLHNFGAKALWTHELERELLEGRIDFVVHCLKDMPTQLPESCEIGCITTREDPRDALVVKKGLSYKTLADLPDGAVVGTSSVRRSAQIAMRYPKLRFKDVRGNIGTRLAKLDDEQGEYSCLVLAAAGLLRLDLADRITCYLDSKTPGGGMLYAVGQGALALEVRSGDEKTLSLLKSLHDEKTALATLAERSLMRTLEGGCSVPIGVETEWVEKGKLLIKGVVVSLDGKQAITAERLGEVLNEKDSDELGWNLAQDLVNKGAAKVLEEINLNRKIIDKQGGA